MRKILLIASTFLCYTAFSQTTKVLFVGNSYTYVNNLPQMLHDLALSLGDTIYFDSSAPGGYTFQQHSTYATTISKINASNWDYVVLQAQSQEPSFPPAQVQSQTFPYAAVLDNIVHANSECTKIMYYMTWGRKYGDASNCAAWPPICTYEGMTSRLRWAYIQMATDNYSQVAPVGMAWYHSRMADSTINLWSGDNSHPSVAGTYLTACTFYASIFHQSPVGSTYYGGLSPADAGFLQQIAASTVLDSMGTWLLNQLPVHADFSFTQNSASVQFNQAFYNTTASQWDFGDGNTSVSENPLHLYTANGNYTVQLIASNSCYSDTITRQVLVSGVTGIEIQHEDVVSVYPNPVSDNLYLHLNEADFRYSLADVSGRIVLAGSNKNMIELNTLPTGIYVLKIDTGIEIRTFRIIKD